MLCSISGEVPQNPVASKKSGHLFEKRLIEKYLIENDNKCPITGQTLYPEDLIEVQTLIPAAPRPPTAASIPSLLSIFQKEMDAIMLESFNLKKQYEQARQQLSHSLYQNDSALRAIARLTEERDEARTALTEINKKIKLDSAQAEIDEDVEAEVNVVSLPEEVIDEIMQRSEILSKGRKKRVIPKEVLSSEEMKSLTEVKSIQFKSEDIEGIDNVAVCDGCVAISGNDGFVQIYDLENDVLVTSFEVESRHVLQLVWDKVTKRIFVVKNDGIDCYNPQARDDFNKFEKAGSFDNNDGSVTSFALHPHENFAASTSGNSWSFLDISIGKKLGTFSSGSANSLCGQFHPDGKLFAVGNSDGVCEIWNLKDQTKAADFEGHEGGVTSLSFSENGYFLATISQSNQCKIWDLRKLGNVATLQLEFIATNVAFDPFGTYLAISDEKNVYIYKQKSWGQPLIVIDAQVKDFAFSPLTTNLFTVSKTNSSLKIFGA